jgi:hypothetical protein
MQTFTSKTSTLAYAIQFGWTQADAKRAFENLTLPVDEIALMNAMVRFAGPELLNRQYAQRGQKSQVTKKKNELKAIEQQHVEMIQNYEEQIRSDRSSFIVLIKHIYGIANTFGYKDPWVESLIVAYDKYVTEDNTTQKAA